MTTSDLSRRGLLTGAGVVAGGALLAKGGVTADAATPSRRAQSSAAPHAAPGPLPDLISSAPEPGIAYRFVNWQEFLPEASLAYGRRFGGGGVYTDVTGDYLACAFDVAPGARIHDVEFYLANTSAVTVYGITWQSGVSTFDSAGYWLQQTAPADGSLHAVRYSIPASKNGPFPHGTKCGISLFTPTNGAVQINGVRIGFANAPRSTVLLPSAVRVYDSRPHTPIKAGQTRSINVSSHVPVGAGGAIVSLSVLGTHQAGSLHVGASGTSLAAVGLQWARTGDRVTAQCATGLSAGHALSVRSSARSGATDFLVDLVGYLV